LRAWERRYGLLDPQRSAGGFRLCWAQDEAIVRFMLAEIERGFPPAQAARLALAGARMSDAAESGRFVRCLRGRCGRPATSRPDPCR